MTALNPVLITDMAILVGIFLLGFVAKMFPRGNRQSVGKKQQEGPGRS